MSEETQNAPAPPAGPETPERAAGSTFTAPAKLVSLTKRVDWRVTAAIILCLFGFLVWRATTTHAKPGTAPGKASIVAVARVTRENLTQELTCDAELRPFQEVDLHAKVAGYLEKINVDIGDRVKAGQLLATIEIPELQDDIRRAEAVQRRAEQAVASAQAAYDAADLIYSRLGRVNKAQPNAIAQQELDAAQTKDQTTASNLAQAKADVEVARAELNKLLTMKKYSEITAPFSGVITRRYADPGSLIQAGTSSSTQTLPLVRLSQNNRLRLDVPVSVSYVSRIHVGDPVKVRINSCDKELVGTIARATGKLETSTRTMTVELDVPNEDFSLIPGMYASALLRLEHRERTLAVPIQAVSRKKNSTVMVINPQNRLEERVISLGLETPNQLEVLSGLKENEMVMLGSRTQVEPGQTVEPKVIQEARGE